jgi:hypothetical protein
MSPTTPVDPDRPAAARIGPRLAGVIAAGGVVLLMLFALVSGERGAVPGLAVAAGTAAISTIVWVVRRIVIAAIPGDTAARRSTPDSAANDADESEDIR